MAEYKYNANYIYRYEISDAADEEVFKKQCKALEKHIPGLEKIKYLIDVDYSKIQAYQKEGQQLLVINDIDIDAVYIKSEFDIVPYFE